MPAEKSKVLKEGQKELKRLRGLKQEILDRMPKKKTIFTKALVLLLEEQLNKLEDKIREAEEKLIEATKITDIVNPDVLDKVKDIVEDVAEGKTDDVIERVKDIGEEELDKIIDKKIKDETIAETAKDVIERTMEGDLEGVVDVLKDGAKKKAKEEAEEFIDKKVKNEKIAAILKDVVDGAVEGEWDGLLDVVKDGLVDIAEGKLEEFINKLLELFEAQIKIKIELDMKEESKVLIPKALQVGKKKAGPHWSVKLVKNLSIRLVKETAIIIKAEIKRLTSKGGLKILTEIAKDALILTLKNGLGGRKIKDLLKDLVKNIVEHDEFKKIIKDFKRKMLAMFIRVVEEEVERVVGGLIDAFIRVHTPYLGTVLDTGKRTAKIGPLWGCVSLALSIQANFNAKVNVVRKGLGGTGTFGFIGKIQAGVGISIGFDIPLVGDISIEGGIKAGPVIDASTSLKFKFKDAIAYVSVVPVTLDVKLAATLYLETPIPNRILKYVPAYLSSVTVVNSTINRELGHINLITATTPGYKFSYDLIGKEYAYLGPDGGYKLDASPVVKAYLKDLKDAVVEAAQSVVDAVDPTNWDLNPFDDEGWIGSLF